MKKNLYAVKLSICALLFIFITGCKKDDPASLPVLTTTPVSNISEIAAKSGGNITSDGGAPIIARGVCWNINQDPTISNNLTTDSTGTGSYSSSITGLQFATTYYVRAYATNSVGTAYGSQVNFSTLAVIPELTTTAISNITDNTATSGGNITSDGGASITARGVCWSTSHDPTISNSFTTNGTGVGLFNSSMINLQFASTYYVRAYATNSVGTAYGSEVSFSTISTVTDVDGNVYQTVKIGSQFWMKENLKVTKYRNGDPIPNIENNTQWGDLVTGAYCNYDNVSSNADTYGKLYNWFSVIDSRNIAPTGWHVPSDAEWTILSATLGGDAISGGKLKEAGTVHFADPNVGATNVSGFTGLPSGYRLSTGVFGAIGLGGHYWTSTQSGTGNAWDRLLQSGGESIVRQNFSKNDGFAIRCIKD